MLFRSELTQKPWIVPIPGTTKQHRLEENLGASSIVFTEKELNDLNHVLDELDIDETHF